MVESDSGDMQRGQQDGMGRYILEGPATRPEIAMFIDVHRLFRDLRMDFDGFRTFRVHKVSLSLCFRWFLVDFRWRPQTFGPLTVGEPRRLRAPLGVRAPGRLSVERGDRAAHGGPRLGGTD